MNVVKWSFLTISSDAFVTATSRAFGAPKNRRCLSPLAANGIAPAAGCLHRRTAPEMFDVPSAVGHSGSSYRPSRSCIPTDKVS